MPYLRNQLKRPTNPLRIGLFSRATIVPFHITARRLFQTLSGARSQYTDTTQLVSTHAFTSATGFPVRPRRKAKRTISPKRLFSSLSRGE